VLQITFILRQKSISKQPISPIQIRRLQNSLISERAIEIPTSTQAHLPNKTASNGRTKRKICNDEKLASHDF
jgi:hypothetical protein